MRAPAYAIEVERGRATARCDCGWTSPGVASAGLAGALWDRHCADDHGEELVIVLDAEESQPDTPESVSS